MQARSAPPSRLKDPDTAARAYLGVIGHNPAALTEALAPPTPTP
ncbi:MAG: hypothetical protein WAL59_30635 [Roseiarcus sp.]